MHNYVYVWPCRTGPVVTAGTNFIYTIQLNPFQSSDFGNYTCSATIEPQPTSVYLSGVYHIMSDTLNIKPGTFTI